MMDADAALAWFKKEIEIDGRAFQEQEKRGNTTTSSVHYGRVDAFVRAVVHLGLASDEEMQAFAHAALGRTGDPKGD